MSSLAKLPDIVGFFSYARDDDKKGALSALRGAIGEELAGQLGRKADKFLLFQDKNVIAPGQLWEDEIVKHVGMSVFFIPVVTPRAVTSVDSKYCKFEFREFLKRQAELERKDLIFPILFTKVPELENEAVWRGDEILSIVGERQWVDWRELKHESLDSKPVTVAIERFCEKIADALRAPWESRVERRKAEAPAMHPLFPKLAPAVPPRFDPSRLRDLETFREAPFAPEMVVIPAGEFRMGSDASDKQAFDYEVGPDGGKRSMRIAERFALGKYPVTFEEYDAFCAETGRKKPQHSGWGRGRRPVIDVSWNDAKAYADWLNRQLGATAYGLPSEAQWEYACRAGTDSRYWWGDVWDRKWANGAESFEGGGTSPVGVYPANLWGLYDTIGNVWEWCADVWTGELGGLPGEGHAHERPSIEASVRALRGGSWNYYPWDLRSAIRDSVGADFRSNDIGFRLARTL